MEIGGVPGSGSSFGKANVGCFQDPGHPPPCTWSVSEALVFTPFFISLRTCFFRLSPATYGDGHHPRELDNSSYALEPPSG